MKKFVLMFFVLLAAGTVSDMTANAADWRFPVGFTYVNGFGDVVDLHKDNLEEEGFEVETDFYNPVGISFQPYVQLDNGIRIGTGIGPVLMLVSSEADFFDVPVNLNGGYVFLPKALISPYVRAGISYHIAGGDYVESSKAGFLAAVGVEFFRTKPVGFGFEIGYDSAEIEFEKLKCTSPGTVTRSGSTTTISSRCSAIANEENEKIEPAGFIASIFVVF